MPIKKGGIMAGQTMRLLRVDIKTRQTKLKQSKSKSLWKTLSLISNYHPTTGYKTKEIEDHITKVTNFINDNPTKNEIIKGADLNCNNQKQNAFGLRRHRRLDQHPSQTSWEPKMKCIR